jgi:two-component system response regulator MprA
MNNGATSTSSILKPANGSRAPRKILIVDDDVVTARAIRTVLTGAGFDTKLCHAGGDAIAQLDGFVPDAAMVDVHLKDLNGLVLAQQLRQRLAPDVPIIMVSGDTSMETLNSLPHVGASYFFSKPLNPEMLVNRLREWLS